MQENKEQITYVRVEGMFCVHCEETVILALKALPGVLSVGIHQNIAEIRSAAPLDKEEIIKAIRAAGYETDTDKFSHKRRQVVLTARWYEMLIIAAAIILLAAGANHFFGYNIFKSIPVVDSEVSYGMLFVTGLLTSIHCVGMCGAIGIFASAEKNSVRSMRRPLLYNIGRVLSYTLTGGIVGAIGSVFSIDMKIRGIIILIAGFFMLLMSLSMLGLAGFHLPTFFVGKFTRVGAGAFLVGLLNGFMPCGPLQAMQLYALSAGGFFKGALSMFLFALGTVPLMLSSGALINLTHGKTRVLIGKIASVLILVLSVSMLNRGFLGLGIDVSVALPKKYDGYTAAVIGDGVQIVSLELDFDSFGDMVVQKGIPVTVFFHAGEGKITGCNNEVVCADLGFDVHITPGDNIIEFIPSEEGNFTYTCWMNMIRNHIEVIDDMGFFVKGK